MKSTIADRSSSVYILIILVKTLACLVRNNTSLSSFTQFLWHILFCSVKGDVRLALCLGLAGKFDIVHCSIAVREKWCAFFPKSMKLSKSNNYSLRFIF